MQNHAPSGAAVQASATPQLFYTNDEYTNTQQGAMLGGQTLSGLDQDDPSIRSNPSSSRGNSASPQKRHIPIVYKISTHATSRAFSITLLLPKHRMNPVETCPFPPPSDLPHTNSEIDPLVIQMSLARILHPHSPNNAASSSPSWLDTTALAERLVTGGDAIGLSSSQASQVHTIVQTLAIKLAAGWCPELAESVQVEIVLSEERVTLRATMTKDLLEQQQQPQQLQQQSLLPPEFQNRTLSMSRMGSTPGPSSSNTSTLLPPSNTIGNQSTSSIWNGDSASLQQEESFLQSHINNNNGNSNSSNTPFSAPSAMAGIAATTGRRSSFSTTGSDMLPPSHFQTLPNNSNHLNVSSSSRGFQRSYSMGSHNSSSSPSTPIGSIGSSYGGASNNNSMFSSPRGSPYSNWYPGGNGPGGGGVAGAGTENATNSRNFLEPHQNQQNQFRPQLMNPGSSPSHSMLQSQQQQQQKLQRSSPSNNMGNNMAGAPWNASPKSFSSITGGGSPPRIWNRAKSVDTGMATPPPPSMKTLMRPSPDPMQIVEPLKAMGFSQRQCDAAVQAIRNLSLEESSHTNVSLPFRSTSQGSFTNTNSNFEEAEERLYASAKEQETRNGSQNGNDNQLSGEDILDYVLSSSDNQQTSGRLLEQDRNNKIHTINSDMAKMENTMRNLLANSEGSKENPSRENRVWEMTSSSHMQSSLQQDGQQGISNMHSQSSVWGNAGKLKAVKNSLTVSGGNNNHDPNGVSEESIPDSGSSGGNNQWAQSGYNPQEQQQNVMKMLNIPPDLNAFVFHCNSNTREECLQRGLFGCPSGGQYGPHSKAKKGDLLFLADFSAWTVTGIFTAACDAAMNIERSALGGKFPWQIRLNEWNELRTVHIDKVNEIIGLASGSKLNMLSKDQLISLVTSKEFSPCVPEHLFKTVPISSQGSKVHSTEAIAQKEQLMSDNFSEGIKRNTIPNQSAGGVKYQKVNMNISAYDEHPATAMRRLKLVTSWFDSVSSEIMTMNEIYNNKKSPRRSSQKERPSLDDDLLKEIKNGNQPWNLMSFSHIRRAVADIFDKWMHYVHSIGSEETRSNRQNQFGGNNSEGNWTRQRSSSSSGKIREDPVLLSNVPGTLDQVQKLLQRSSLSVPTYEMTSALASKMIRELEEIANEVRKTQSSLIKIGGDDYAKSVKDQNLGMHLNEEVVTCYDEGGEKIDKVIIRIEWHTKSSIAQGRPPQVQKLYKTHFDMLERNYKTVSGSTDPKSMHLLTRIFVLLCRYDLIGDIRGGGQVFVPPGAMKAMAQHFGVTHECFATPLNRMCRSYNSFLFFDVDRHFGSLGPFYDFLPFEGSFQVNPPEDCVELVLNHVFDLLRNSGSGRNALSFLLVVNKSHEVDLQNVKNSKYLRRAISVESKSFFLGDFMHKDSGPSSRKLKSSDDASAFDFGNSWSTSGETLLIWLQNDVANDLWTPTDANVVAVMKQFE